MGSIAQKLQNIIDSKAAISAAIETKGGTVPTELTGYGAAIEALPSGGGSDVVAKIVDRTVTEVTAADLNGATSIGTRAFSNCSDLSSISLPNSVTSIDNYAFYNCSNCLIYDFSNHTSVPTLASTNAFTNTNFSKKIIVPDALYDSWKAANNWNSSTNSIVGAITKASEA
jgi:hypothetical protein